ncbi:MAG: response regulator [Oscillibacter sp.]|nr:response regulator [Oscillibacter sp.]
MNVETKKNQRIWLVVLIVICMGIILIGGLGYVNRLRNNLRENAIQNVMTVTVQQQQAIDTFITGDRERLHSFADFYSVTSDINAEEVWRQLGLFSEVDAIYSVMCLDDGWFCSSSSDLIRQVDEENLSFYRSLEGSGVRSAYDGLFSGAPKFGYYEAFVFQNGHKGLIQKSYDRTKVSEEFSLSFYNNQGIAYVINAQGDILLWSTEVSGDRFDENIFDLLSENDEQGNIDAFKAALAAEETGSLVFRGDGGNYIYTYVPMESVDEWYLVSSVPVNAITEETDRILLDSQMALGLLALILAFCAVFILLIWRAQRDMRKKDQEIEYQTQLFDIFSTYIADNSGDIYMMLDHTTEKLEYVTPNVERVLGVGKESVIEFLQASDMAKDPEATVAYYDEVNALAPGETVTPRRTERVHAKTGEHRWFLENAYCAVIQGKPKRVVYISDRTRERETQNNLLEALKIAQTANSAKSSFLSSVSHDIRTPMNAIIGFTNLLREEAGNPDVVLEYTQRIDAASQHLLGLINDVLDMNKIESGSATLNLSDVNLAEVIDEINTIIRPQARAKDQTFEIFASPLTHENLRGDKLRINQILINLLSNAVKYTPAGGDIQMRIEERAQVVEHYSRIRFTVSDNGLGMSEDYQKVIFDAFSREQTAATRQIQGTGLGMAITKSLVDLMGGTIDVKSTLGEGSVFTVELELFIQEREDDPRFWTKHKVSRMIVADDDEVVCKNIVKVMAGTGVAVDYATDGETAIRMMRESREAGKPYDLILLDWQMPDLNGLETARIIRENYPEKIPILLLTAYDWSEIEQEAKEIGVSHFMPKPFFMSTFKDSIQRIMGGTKDTGSGKDDILKDRRILVVDDIEVNRIILVKILQTLGAACDVAENGQEALKKFEQSQPGEYDMILMDVQMPVMDGYAATRAIRACAHPEGKTVPVIAMTANAFVDDIRDAINAGMDAHVAKPIQIDKLKEAIGQVLEGRPAAENGQ